MQKISKVFIFSVITCALCVNTYSQSARHHVINMGRNTLKVVSAPLKGVFITGPQNIKKAYTYEVWERENPTKRGLLRYKVFALWRAPGEEIKGVIDGLVESIQAGGNLLKNFLSLFFSD